MWTPNASNKSNSNRVDINGRPYMTHSTPSESSRAASNDSRGNNERIDNNTDKRSSTYFPRSFVQQAQASVPASARNTPHISTNIVPGDLNIGGFIDYGTTQRQKEHVVQPQQYSIGRSPGFVFGAINSSHHPLLQDHDSSNGTGFYIPTPGNRDNLHSHGSRQYQHMQQSQPRFYNPLRGKEVIKHTQGAQLRPDDYGMLGLLKIIKGVNPGKTTLAMGVDPHSLGLELTSSDPIHKKFASPWPDKLGEGPKYDVPECYNSRQPPPLQRGLFKKFNVAMLFYIFYSMPKDKAQLFAADELHDRGWYYHKNLCMWFTREKNSVPSVKNATYEVGCYTYFDYTTWSTIRQDNVILYYDMIEQRPMIPH